jgi:hypothetical protein
MLVERADRAHRRYGCQECIVVFESVVKPDFALCGEYVAIFLLEKEVLPGIYNHLLPRLEKLSHELSVTRAYRVGHKVVYVQPAHLRVAVP